MKKELIAPCGMNCGICKRYLAYSRNIPEEKGKLTHCRGCIPSNRNCYIKKGCKKLRNNEIESCSQCKDMPCKNIKHIDKRYRKNYNMSMIENLNEIKNKGMKKFLENQRKKYKCPVCSGIICVHDNKCYDCGYVKIKT